MARHAMKAKGQVALALLDRVADILRAAGLAITAVAAAVELLHLNRLQP